MASTRPALRTGWTSASLSSLLSNARLAGLRTYHGEVVADAVWDAILDRQTWEQVAAQLDSARSHRRQGRASRRLLVGFARCGKCGGPMWSASRAKSGGGRRWRYVCVSGPERDGCGGITVWSPTPVDELIRKAVVNRLAGDGLAEARRLAAGDDDAEARAADHPADAERRLDELATDYADGTITRREWLAARERLEERIAAAERTLARNSHAATLTDLPSDRDALEAKWERSDVEWRKAVLRAVADPSGSGGPFDPNRVEVVWQA